MPEFYPEMYKWQFLVEAKAEAVEMNCAEVEALKKRKRPDISMRGLVRWLIRPSVGWSAGPQPKVTSYALVQ